MARIFFVTHPEVVIDPQVPIPRWPLSAVGRARAEAFAESLAAEGIALVYSSDEQKALDGGEILAARLGAPHRVDADLGENDRSSTGYIAPPEFWEVVEVFFGRPDESVRGWETARDAQARIVAAVRRVAQAALEAGDVVIVSHGGVGRLLTAHLQGVEIGQESRPGHPGGGSWIVIDAETFTLTQDWRDIPA